MPSSLPQPPCPDLLRHTLRGHAETLRREAAAIEAELRSLPAYDRADVWEGGRATAFRADLDAQLRRLTTPGSGLCDAMRDAASRIERRADDLAIEPAPASTTTAAPLSFCPPP